MVRYEQEKFMGRVKIGRRNIIKLFQSEVRYASIQDNVMFCADTQVEEGFWKNHGMNRAF